jgi:MFS family permease
MERKLVRAFIILKVLEIASTGFAMPTYVPFLLHTGLTQFQANQVNIAYMFVSTLLDPLTGSLADKIGQKKTYLLGFLFLGTGSLIYGVGHGFWAFILAESTAAIGSALWSEALESWLRCLSNNQTSHVTLAKAGYYSRFTTIVCGLTGAWLATYFGLQIPWFLCAGVSFVGLAISIVITRNLPDVHNHGAKSKETISKALNLITHTPQIRFALIVSCVCYISFQPFNMFWSPIFEDMTGSVGWLGFMWVGISLFTALGSFIVQKVPRDKPYVIGLTVLSTGLPMLVPGILFGAKPTMWPLLFCFLLHEIGRAGIYPLVFSHINDHIPNDVRATVNSLRSSTSTIGSVIGLSLSGFLTQYISRVQVWYLSAGLLIVLAIWIFISQKSKPA